MFVTFTPSSVFLISYSNGSVIANYLIFTSPEFTGSIQNLRNALAERINNSYLGAFAVKTPVFEGKPFGIFLITKLWHSLSTLFMIYSWSEIKAFLSATGYMFSRPCHRLMFSRTCHRLHVFPPLPPFTCFPTLATVYMFSHPCHRLHVFPRLPTATRFPAHLPLSPHWVVFFITFVVIGHSTGSGFDFTTLVEKLFH